MIKVTFDPANYDGPTGVVSFISWSNPDLHKAMREMFHESPREQVVELVVQREGIKAKFEPRNAANF